MNDLQSQEQITFGEDEEEDLSNDDKKPDATLMKNLKIKLPLIKVDNLASASEDTLWKSSGRLVSSRDSLSRRSKQARKANVKE